MKRTIIYGAGDIGEHVNFEVLSLECEIVAYCDADDKKTGSLINGYVVISKRELRRFVSENKIQLIIVAIWNESLRKQLISELQNLLLNQNDVQVYGYHEIFVELRKVIERNGNSCSHSLMDQSVDTAGRIGKWIQRKKSFYTEIQNDLKDNKVLLFSEENDSGLASIFDWAELSEIKAGSIIINITNAMSGCNVDNWLTKKGVTLINADVKANYYSVVNSKIGKSNSFSAVYAIPELISEYINDANPDCIVINESLEDCISPSLVLAECFRILKTGGHILIVGTEKKDYPEYVLKNGKIWSFRVTQKNECCVDSSFESQNISKLFREQADVSYKRKDDLLLIIITKRGEAEPCIKLPRLQKRDKEELDIAFSLEQAKKEYNENNEISNYIENLYDEINTVDDICGKIDTIFAKGERKLNNRYDIAFFFPIYAYLSDAAEMLIKKSAECSCCVAYPKLSKIKYWNAGVNNLKRLFQFLLNIPENIAVVSADSVKLKSAEIGVCMDMGYSIGCIPYDEMGDLWKKTALVQTTPFYTHLFYDNPLDSFKAHFPEDKSSKLDYIICSAYIRDWLKRNDLFLGEKALAFGYPRLDNLYQTYISGIDVPEQIKKRIADKTVFFTTVYQVDQLLPFFERNNEKRILVWRPHPLVLDKINTEALENKYALIVDREKDYNLSFHISHALISEIPVSLNVNYLFWKKPVLLVDGVMGAKGYENEEWYRSMYHAKNESDIDEFIMMVENNEIRNSTEKEKYQSFMTQHFDGKVSERIINYFVKTGEETFE